jgi:hypothetical protein
MIESAPAFSPVLISVLMMAGRALMGLMLVVMFLFSV